MSGHGQNIPAPTAPLPTPATDGPDKKLVIVGIVGSVLAVLGSFLGWVTVEDADESLAGTDGDGVFTLITAAITAVLLIVGMVTRKGMVAASAAVPALITFAIGLLNFLDPARLAKASAEGDEAFEGASSEEIDAMIEGIEWTTAAGLWIVLLGALAGVIAGVMAGLKARSSN
ncbi:hypothetical protein [Streptomyces sp. B6B3]|uniref:hypothetical protein n=1 Tax=Streptomyces sp. B6B3 TaxID=3153570 RepID=UPI00325ECE63